MRLNIISALRLVCLRQAAEVTSTSGLTPLPAALQVLDGPPLHIDDPAACAEIVVHTLLCLQGLPTASPGVHSLLPSTPLRALSGRCASTSAPATEYISLNTLADNPGATHYVRTPTYKIRTAHMLCCFHTTY